MTACFKFERETADSVKCYVCGHTSEEHLSPLERFAAAGKAMKTAVDTLPFALPLSERQEPADSESISPERSVCRVCGKGAQGLWGNLVCRSCGEPAQVHPAQRHLLTEPALGSFRVEDGVRVTMDETEPIVLLMVPGLKVQPHPNFSAPMILTPRDARLLAAQLLEVAEGEYPLRCPSWEPMTRTRAGRTTLRGWGLCGYCTHPLDRQGMCPNGPGDVGCRNGQRVGTEGYTP